MSGAARQSDIQFPSLHAIEGDMREQLERDALRAELQVSRAREAALILERDELSQRQAMLTQEFEHRLINGLQLMASLLSLQSRTATPEAAAQLTIAARRVAALGRVHRQLHLLDHQDSVELKGYLQHLCADLSSLYPDSPRIRRPPLPNGAIRILPNG
jgi:two-component sensor histidine kinase